MIASDEARRRGRIPYAEVGYESYVLYSGNHDKGNYRGINIGTAVSIDSSLVLLDGTVRYIYRTTTRY